MLRRALPRVDAGRSCRVASRSGALGRLLSDQASLSEGGFVERVEQLAERRPELLRQRVTAPTGFGSERLEEGATALFSLPLDEADALTIAQCLLKVGVDVTATDASGFTAAERASQRGQGSLAQWLSH